MKIIGIYKIQSIIRPERIYIGSTINVFQRWNKHRYDLKQNKHHSIKLQRHFNKYGINDLIFTLIEECSKEKLLVREQYFLDMTNTYFNICKNAKNCLGRIPWNKNKKMPKEFCQKMRVINLGNKNRIGYRHTVESKKKISDKLKNKFYGKYKTTPIQRNEIKQKYIPKQYTANMLAKEYGVSKDTILYIIHSLT